MTSPESNGQKSSLRFGIMCNGMVFSAWEAQCITQLIQSELAMPAVLIIDKDAGVTYGRVSRAKKIKNLKNLLWYLYSFFIVRPRSFVLRPTDMSVALQEVPRLVCKVTTRGKFSQYFEEEDLKEIRSYGLDFILRFGFNIIRGEIHNTARYGIWSFHHDDEEKYRGGPACFWELYFQDHVNGAILQRLTNKLDAGIILRKGFFKTNLKSFTANRNFVYTESASWPVQVCKDIMNGVVSYAEALPSSSSAPIYTVPTNGQMLTFGYHLIRNRLRNALHSFFYYWHWNIGVCDVPIEHFLSTGVVPMVNWLPAPPPSRFYADPFGIKTGSGSLIVFEDLDYTTNIGTLSAYKYENGEYRLYRDVLRKKCHLSYPFILEHHGKVYCLPESSEINEISLYELHPGTLQFTPAVTLIRNSGITDGTLMRYNEKWWMFCTDKTDGPAHKLNIWYSDSLEGEWKEHANNPVKTDIRGARPGGTPFIFNNNWYRPAQDCSKHYGWRTGIYKITKLNEQEYEEELVNQLDPHPDYPHGLHTVSAFGNQVIVDGVKLRFVGLNKTLLYFKIKKLMAKFLPEKQ